MYEKQVLGSGPNILAVTACIHGNEIVGKHIHDWLKTLTINAEWQIWLIFGNPKAYEANKRFTQVNLNRVFPGNADGNYEEQQAHRIMQELAGCTIHVDLHSRSTLTDCTPFVLTNGNDSDKKLVESTGLPNVIVYPKETTAYEGKTLLEAMTTPSIAVECGQHTDPKAVEQGKQIMENVLTYYEIIPGQANLPKQTWYQVEARVKEVVPGMTVLDNIKEFELVQKGQLLAQGNNHSIYAGQAFYPILIDRIPAVQEKGVLMLRGKLIE